MRWEHEAFEISPYTSHMRHDINYINISYFMGHVHQEISMAMGFSKQNSHVAPPSSSTVRLRPQNKLLLLEYELVLYWKKWFTWLKSLVTRGKNHRNIPYNSWEDLAGFRLRCSLFVNPLNDSSLVATIIPRGSMVLEYESQHWPSKWPSFVGQHTHTWSIWDMYSKSMDVDTELIWIGY